MMKIIKPAIDMIVLAFTSLILFTGSPFQIANNLVENNGHLSIKYFGLQVYAADDDDETWIREVHLWSKDRNDHMYGDSLFPVIKF